MSETTDAAHPTEGTEAADMDTLAAKAAWMLDNGATNESRDLCEGVLALRARLTGEAQGAREPRGWEARWRDLAERLLSRGAGQEHGPERILLMLMAQVEETIPAEPLRAAPPTAKAEAPFKLPARVVALLMPDSWAVYDAAGNLVAETYEREHADFIAAAINAHAPTAKAPSGGEAERKLRAVVEWLEANKPEVFREGLWDAFARVPTPDEPEGEATDDGK